jgi:uncharacterized membrane protein
MAIERGTGGTGTGAARSAQQTEERGWQAGPERRSAVPREERIARALGWFSIALGLAELAAPRQLGRMIGIRGNPTALRVMGLREVASGVGILAAARPAGWLWSRVGGDAIHLALLGKAMASPGAQAGRAAAATAAVAGVTAIDVFCGQRLSRRPATGAIHVKKTLGVNRSADALYRAWRDLPALPRFMSHLESVQETGPNRSRWTARGPAGTTVEWDAEIVDDRPGESIAWRSLPGADVDSEGSVRFSRASGGRGTEVVVELEYRPPAGAMGATLAQLFGKEPGQQIQEDLRRFKQLMETGECPTTEGQPAGPASSRLSSLVPGRARRRS